MELMKLYINITEMYELNSGGSFVRMILFDGRCEGEVFHGKILPGAVDTQMSEKDGGGTLSARYMLEGWDCENNPCRLFIENSARFGNPETSPAVRTDSPALRWLEEAELEGRLENGDSGLVITISRKPAASAKERINTTASSAAHCSRPCSRGSGAGR